MTKQRKWFWTGVSGLVLAVVLGAGFGLLKHQPHFYRQSLAVKGDDSKELSRQFVGQMTTMIGFLIDGKGHQDFIFTQEELNSYFAEDFIALGESETLRKHGIHEPRLVLEDDKLRLAFRYGSGLLATVISYDLRVWLAPKEVNVVAIEIMAKRAGAIPMSSQSLLDGIADVVRTKGIEVTWYRRDSNPVALVRFQADRPQHRTARLLGLAVRPSSITLAGFSGDETTAQAPALSPVATAEGKPPSVPPPLAQSSPDPTAPALPPSMPPPLTLTPFGPPPAASTPSVPPLPKQTPSVPAPPPLTPSVPVPPTAAPSVPPPALPIAPPLPPID